MRPVTEEEFGYVPFLLLFYAGMETGTPVPVPYLGDYT
jgi:hypothetical protein